MINEATQLALLFGAFGGLLGSIGHVWSDQKLRTAIMGNPMKTREAIVNVIAWTIVAMMMGVMAGLEEPWLGFVIGVVAGYFGNDITQKVLLAINEELKLQKLLELNKGIKSLEALKTLLERLEFVKGVDILDKVGEIDIRIIPEDFWNPDEHLSIITDIINTIRPIGIRMNLIQPAEVIINVSGVLTVQNNQEPQAIIDKATDIITKYINGRALGEEIRLNHLMVEFVGGKVPGVIDILQLATNPPADEEKVLRIDKDKVSRVGSVNLTVKPA